MGRSRAWALAIVLGVCSPTAAVAAEGLRDAEGAAHGEAHGDEHGELHLLDVLKSTEFLGTIVNFGVLMVLLWLAVKKKANPALAARREDIKRNLDEAQRLRAEAAATHAHFKERLEKLDQEMEQIRADMVKAGEAERDRIVAQAEEKAARMRRDTRFLIEQQIKQLRQDLGKEAAEAAVAAAEKLLLERTGSAEQERLAEGYVKRLDEMTRGGPQA